MPKVKTCCYLGILNRHVAILRNFLLFTSVNWKNAIQIPSYKRHSFIFGTVSDYLILMIDLTLMTTLTLLMPLLQDCPCSYDFLIMKKCLHSRDCFCFFDYLHICMFSWLRWPLRSSTPFWMGLLFKLTKFFWLSMYWTKKPMFRTAGVYLAWPCVRSCARPLPPWFVSEYMQMYNFEQNKHNTLVTLQFSLSQPWHLFDCRYNISVLWFESLLLSSSVCTYSAATHLFCRELDGSLPHFSAVLF